MPPLSISSTKNPDWMRGPGYAFPPPVFLLDELERQPLWAHSIGQQLRTGQTSIGTVEREDNTQVDLFSFLVNGVMDLAALAAWSEGGDVELLDVTNAAAVSTLASIAADPGERALVVDAGSPIVGANGLLAARFTAAQIYSGNNSLGLTGAPAFTIVCDLNGDADAYGGCVGLGTDTAAQKTIVLTIDYGALGGAVEADHGDTDYAVIYNLPAAPFTAGWAQLQAAAAATLSAYVAHWQGVLLTVNDGFGANSAATLEDTGLCWGSTPEGNYKIAGLMANAFVWDAQIGVADQPLVDAFEAANHS